MLEEEIKKLTEAVKLLTETLKQEKEIKPKTEKAIKQKAETPESPKIEIPKDINELPTIEELQSICTRIVRADRDKKRDIVNILDSYNGAKTISQVPSENLHELKSRLLEL